MTRNELFLNILKDQVVPALGCTEPGAIAYAVARANELCGCCCTSLNVCIDKNVLKNGLGVGIPGTSEVGIPFACALALVVGKSEYKLEALKEVTPEAIEEAKKIVESGIIKIEQAFDAPGLYIEVKAKGAEGESRVIIESAHKNLCYEEKNGEVLMNNRVVKGACDDAPKPVSLQYELKNYTLKDFVEFVNEVSDEDLAFIQDGMDMNLKIAQSAFDDGLGICNSLLERESGKYGKAKAYTAAGSEARMTGSPLPVMSSAGSGNHGITAIIPITVVGMEEGRDLKDIRRAVALSHLVTNYTKVYLGPLSPVCGCGVAAGLGAASGLTYMRGGSLEQIRIAINNIGAGITGMFCDGAKMGCSLKVACAANSAIDASELALKGVEIDGANGILANTAEQTIQNIAEVSNKGMNNTDNVILGIMLRQAGKN